MNAGDYLTIPTTVGNRLFWLVESVNTGGIGQESLVRLRRLSQRPGQDEGGVEHETVLVPEMILRRAGMLVLTPQQQAGWWTETEDKKLVLERADDARETLTVRGKHAGPRA